MAMHGVRGYRARWQFRGDHTSRKITPFVLTNKTEKQIHSKLLHFVKEEGIAQVCGNINYTHQ